MHSGLVDERKPHNFSHSCNNIPLKATELFRAAIPVSHAHLLLNLFVAGVRWLRKWDWWDLSSATFCK